MSKESKNQTFLKFIVLLQIIYIISERVQMENEESEEDYFKGYIDLAKEDTIPWDKFVSLMETLTPTFARAKILIKVLLQEFKNCKEIHHGLRKPSFKNIACQQTDQTVEEDEEHYQQIESITSVHEQSDIKLIIPEDSSNFEPLEDNSESEHDPFEAGKLINIKNEIP